MIAAAIAAVGLTTGHFAGSVAAPAPAAATAVGISPAGPRLLPGWPVIMGSGINASPAAADLDGDGGDELAVGTRDGQVFLLDVSGRCLPGWPRSVTSQIHLGVLLCDLGGDGEIEVLAVGDDGRAFAWRRDGSELRGWPVDLGSGPAADPIEVRSPGGSLVALPCTDGTVHLLGPDGKESPGWPRRGPPLFAPLCGMRRIVAGDLDADGQLEILCLHSTPAVLSAWRLSGEACPGFPLPVGEAGEGLAVEENAGRQGGVQRIACGLKQEVVIVSRHGEVLQRLSLSDPADWVTSAPAFASTSGSPGGVNRLLAVGTQGGTVHLWDERGRLLPGWPVRLGGFIYGLQRGEEKFVVTALPVFRDVDGDHVVELLAGCYDQHLYAFALNGKPLPGWPVSLDDALECAPVFARLDPGRPPVMIAGQSGESLYAFELAAGGPSPGGSNAVSATPSRGERSARLSVAVLAALALLLLLTFGTGRPRRPRRERPAGRGRRAILTLLVAVVVVRVGWSFSDLLRYREAQRRLQTLDSTVERLLGLEEARTERLAGALAIALESAGLPSHDESFRLLYSLERITDAERLDYRSVGLAVVDGQGSAVQSLGLARGYPLPEGSWRASTPLLLADVPVTVGRAPLKGGWEPWRLVLASSLLTSFPQALAEATGFAVQITLGGRTLAWGGVAPPSPGAWPWLAARVPARVIPLAGGGGGSGVQLCASVEGFERPGSDWVDLGFLLLTAGLFTLVWPRPAPLPQRPSAWWPVALVGIYAVGWWSLSGGDVARRPEGFAGHDLGLLLHLLGLLGVVNIYRLYIGERRERRLSFALLASYATISVLPLALVLLVTISLVRNAQRRMAADVVSELTARAEHMVLTYVGSNVFQRGLAAAAREQSALPTETAWYNFVSDSQMLFAYELPSAYLTLWANDVTDSTRRFTGYSYRAPRSQKFYDRRPRWTGRRNEKGLFLDGGTAVVRAVHDVRYDRAQGTLVSHIPLDGTIIERLEERLRMSPFLPPVRLEIVGPGVTVPAARSLGRPLPLSNRLLLPARDWRSGQPRWVVMEAQPLLPPGREGWGFLAFCILLLLLPLSLSFYGAYATYQRAVRPMSRLLTGIRRVQTGDLDYRLGDQGQSEIALAARAFDHMTESLRTTVKELAEKQKVEEVSALKSRFISMVSHDLKTPLAAIQGAAENLLTELAGPVTGRQRTYLRMILSSSENLQGMITDLLDLSRLESGRIELDLEPLDLRRETAEILQAVRPLLEQRGLRTELDAEVDPALIRADRVRLWQIVNNLLGNAIRYSPDGGCIRMRIWAQGDAAARGGAGPASADGERLCLSISDEGPGLPAGDPAQLFEPFVARPAGPQGAHGAGLGLAIVKQLVELHGGVVRAENLVPAGARFTFDLPRAAG